MKKKIRKQYKEPELEIVAIPMKGHRKPPEEPKQPIVVEVNIDMHPRIPYYRPVSTIIFEAFLSAFVASVVGLIILSSFL